MGLGALELESDEMSVTLDDHRKSVVDLVPKAGLEIHHTIAECMIFANRAVGERITKTFPRESLLRRHPPPKEQFFDRLIQAAAIRGHTINVLSNHTLARSLDAAVDPTDPE
jgi:DIS3-like exonuclease 1